MIGMTATEETTIPEGMSAMKIMDRNGDTKIMWDPENKDEVDAAEKTFKELTKKGMIAYSVKKSGKQGEVVKTFDPKAERLILAPALQGG